MGRIRRVFLGGNTSLGFYSYYDYILGQEEAARIFVIKGGPGAGKSTFMKKIGMEMAERGYDIEFIHCSSDSNSLDGMVIPALKVALLDGTAPHVVDPKNPGAVDEIINLGDFWDETGLREHKEEILRANREKSGQFSRAYRYIKAAAILHEDSAVIYGRAVDAAKINMLAEQLVSETFKYAGISDKEGKQRHLFASAITPNGLKNFLETILDTGRVYAIKGKQGTGTERILEKLRTAAVERGYYTESYYCALNPKKLEHLVIPELDVSFTTVNEYHDAGVDKDRVIDLDELMDSSLLKNYSDVLDYNKREFDSLLWKAVDTIKKAKAIHERLEEYYIKNMDFEAVARCRESILARILEEEKHLFSKVIK